MAVLIFFMDFPLWSFPASLFCGAISAVVALKKGYQAIPGFVVGLMLGPLAILAYFVIPRTQDAKRQEELEQRINREQSDAAKTRLCPNCHRVLSVTARVCPKCETRFDAASSAS